LSNMSGIDLNRAGTPLLEIVTEPDMRSSTEAVDYAKALHALVQWLDICDGNMQEGSFRCDANVSVRRPGQPFGTRREIKNLNSFRHLQQAIDYEINWQISELEDGRPIVQATVLFDPDTGETRMMRTKEDAQDYRYFPDPDLPPLVISREWVEQVRAQMPELPRAMAERFQKHDGLAPADAALMTQSLATARYYEAARDAGAPAKLVANWVMGEISRRLNADGIEIIGSPVDAALLATLIQRIQDGTISNNAAKQVFDALWTREKGTAGNVDVLIESLGLKQMNDSSELESIIDGVLAANQKSVEEFRGGKEKAFQALVGQAMKASKGKANPAQVNEVLRRKLGA
jgi:aspartyl-tRNA(Asn)/glutamyl-tRNA(Gln) amidotransferase subunit B